MQRGPASPSKDRLAPETGSPAPGGPQSPQGKDALPPVPVGLEHLLALASTSEPFAAALREDPLRAADAAGIELAGAERAILGAVSGPTLDTMIARVKPALVEPDRRLFLERAAAAVAILVGGTTMGGCPETKTAGERSAPLPKRRPEHPPATAGGARVDRPDEPAPPTGIQPDRPPRPPAPPPRPDAGAPRDTSGDLSPGGGGSLPTGVRTPPDVQPPCAGARADPEPTRDRPINRHAKGGVRPQ